MTAPRGLVSKKRGRPSNREMTAPVRDAILWTVREYYYADFGPMLAAEKLAAGHGFSFSSETPAQVDDRRRVMG